MNNGDVRRVGLVFTQEGAVDFKRSLQDINLELNKNYNQFKLTQAQWDKSTDSTERLKAQQEYLSNAYEIQKDKVSTLSMQLSELENAEKKNTTAIKKKRNELLNAEIQLQKYNNNLKNATSELDIAKKGIETTSQKLSRLSREVEENENKFKLVQSRWTAVTKSSEKLKQEQQYLAEAYRLQGEKLETLNIQLKEFETAEGKNSTAIQNKRNEVIKAETELNNYRTKLRLVTNEVENLSAKAVKFGENIEKIGGNIQNIGNKMTAFSTATGVALLTTAKSAIEFEDAFTGVEKTVDGTPEQMNKLKQGIRDLSKEIPSSTTEIAEVAEAAGQLGIQTDNILNFSKAMLDLGNSTNLTAGEAASQLAKFANIMGMSQSDFDKLGSSIVDLGNKYATTEADIVEMAMRLAGAGKQVGMSEGEVLGLATALSSVGIEAEMGGSAISKAMVKMQNAVDIGGNKLNKVLKESGLSLRNLELMSTNDTKSFKELSQELGMTTTEMKQLIVAGTNLENFAKVSGMSAEEFKKAWEEDASGALGKFIQGLAHAEDKGETAISVLSEMGFTEVRLRDSLLRAANAGDLFDEAVKTGTNAWKENLALTNEANKRYGTLKSKIQIAINKLKDVAITLGDKLMPTVDKGVTYIEKLTNKFEGLTDSQIEWILKIGGAVIALGPLIKTVGTLTSVGGSAIKGIGIFTQAIGVMNGKVTSGSDSVNAMSVLLSKLTSPLGLATIGVTALAGTAIYLANKETDAQKATREFANEITNSKKATEEYNRRVDESARAELNHIDYIEKLKEELNTLVDENGKVKKSEEGRVQFILNELKDAIGVETSLNDGVIDGYKNLQGEIDKTIEKKKAEIQLNAGKQKFDNAYNNHQTAIDNLAKAQEEIEKTGMGYDQLKDLVKEWKQQLNVYDELHTRNYNFLENPEHVNLDIFQKYSPKEIEAIENTMRAYDDAKYTVKTNTEVMKQYEENYAKFVEGKYDEMSSIITGTTQDWHDETLETINNSIKEQSNSFGQYMKIYKEFGDDFSKQSMEQAKKNLENLATELANRTSTIEELGPAETEAWKTLASNSYEVYAQKLNTMDDTMRNKIIDVTGVIVQETPDVVEATKKLSNSVVEQMDTDEEFKNKALESLYSYLSGLSNEELRELLYVAGVQNVEKVIQGIRQGNLGEQEGRNILNSLNDGLNNNKFQGTIFNTAGAIAKKLSSILSVKATIIGPSQNIGSFTALKLPGHKTGLDYVPHDDYVARLHEGERVLTKEENKQYTETEKEHNNRRTIRKVYFGGNDELMSILIESNSKIQSLLQKILNNSNKSIVLDTGELVGATANQYNIALAQIKDREGRGS